MKRHYIAPIIGSGTDSDPYRPLVEDYGVPYSAIFPTHPEGHPDWGKPATDWALVIVGGNKHSEIMKDKRLDVLPDWSYDGRISGLSAAAKTGLLKAMQRRGIDTSIVQNQDDYRSVLRVIGQKLTPTFDENDFDTEDR